MIRPESVLDLNSYEEDELKHYGILGMKWGVRRYQNPDGSYTDLGLKRVRKQIKKEDRRNAIKDFKDRRSIKKKYKIGSVQRKQAMNSLNSKIKDREDRLAEERDSRLFANVKDTKDVSRLSDKQLTNRINRLQLEQRYKNLMNDTRVQKKGKSRARQALSDAGANAIRDVGTKTFSYIGKRIVAKFMGTKAAQPYYKKQGDQWVDMFGGKAKKRSKNNN